MRGSRSVPAPPKKKKFPAERILGMRPVADGGKGHMDSKKGLASRPRRPMPPSESQCKIPTGLVLRVRGKFQFASTLPPPPPRPSPRPGPAGSPGAHWARAPSGFPGAAAQGGPARTGRTRSPPRCRRTPPGTRTACRRALLYTPAPEPLRELVPAPGGSELRGKWAGQRGPVMELCGCCASALRSLHRRPSRCLGLGNCDGKRLNLGPFSPFFVLQGRD